MHPEAQTQKKDIIDVIIEIGAGFYGMETAAVIANAGRGISHEMAYRKHVIYYMLREHTFMSYEAIGKKFGTRLSTIYSGVENINDQLSYNRRTIGEIKEISGLIDNFRRKSERLEE